MAFDTSLALSIQAARTIDVGRGRTLAAVVVGLAKYAPFNVQIIQPVAGLDTNNRYYKQYPGIEYNVKVGVRGGDFSALRYTLTNAPDGMTINSLTGQISWPTPVEAGSPHAVTVSVTDGLTTDAVSWTVTVDTNNAIFLDSVNGSSVGTGAINDPMADITDWYGSTKGDNTYAGYFVYYRAGTYLLNCIPKNEPTGGVTLSSSKPRVHLRYNNETPTIDCSVGHWFTDTTIPDLCFDGFTIINVGAYVSPDGGEGVWFSRIGGARHIYRRNTFASINGSTGPNNQSNIMAPFGDCDRWMITENSFDGNNQQCYTVGVFYNTRLAVVESNFVENCIAIGIGFKTNNETQSVRGNWCSGSGTLCDVIGFTGDVDTGNGEYSWNYLNGVEPCRVNYGMVGANNPFYFIRNTLTSPFNIRQWVAAESAGIIYFTDNVVVGASFYVTETSVDAQLIAQDGNLINSVLTEFLDDTTGLLIGSYIEQNTDKGHNGLGGIK